MANGADEEILSGGNVSAGVLRIGNTVRRPVGPWSPAVHSFLAYLESVGFDGAPRVLGVDDQGREVLEYIPGAVPWPSLQHECLGSDEAVWKFGRLLREFHDAASTFVPAAGAVWREPERANDAIDFVDERGVIICHNDPAPWNLVIGDERWVFIDWDFAGPRPFIWDIAYAAIGTVPIARDASWLGWREPVPIVSRMRGLIDGYGLEDRDRDRLVDVVVARIRSSYEHLRRRATDGVEPWLTLWNEGHGEGWADTLSYAEENRAEWHDTLIQ